MWQVLASLLPWCVCLVALALAFYALRVCERALGNAGPATLAAGERTDSESVTEVVHRGDAHCGTAPRTRRSWRPFGGSLGGAERQRKLSAYHEAAHLLVAAELDAIDLPAPAVVNDGACSWAQALELPECAEREALADLLAVLLAGRVGEELGCGEVSNRAQDDICLATRLASEMVRSWGMAKAVGPVACAAPGVGVDQSNLPPCSEQTASLLDEQVRELLDKAAKRAERLVSRQREGLDQVAAAVLDGEAVDRHRLEGVLSGQDSEQTKLPARA